jgi:hypothetical protein
LSASRRGGQPGSDQFTITATMTRAAALESRRDALMSCLTLRNRVMRDDPIDA